MALRVDPVRGQICLVVPRRGSEKAAWRFADENREWIAQHMAELVPPVPFVDGAVIPVFGVDRTIRIRRTSARTTTINLTGTTLDVETPRDDASANIKKFFYKLLMDTVTPIAREKSKGSKRPLGNIQLRDTRARWGSCAPDGRLMFCWKLVFAPPLVLDYVVAHECAHLTHMNHSDRFWGLCNQLSQDMQYARDWLRAHGDRMLIYGTAA